MLKIIITLLVTAQASEYDSLPISEGSSLSTLQESDNGEFNPQKFHQEFYEAINSDKFEDWLNSLEHTTSYNQKFDWLRDNPQRISYIGEALLRFDMLSNYIQMKLYPQQN